MKKTLIIRQQFWHTVCCLTALLACLPLLWPRMLPRAWRNAAPEYAGDIILASVLVSFLVLGISSLFLLLKLRNLRTLIHLAIWASQWFLACCIFTLLAYFADVPAPVPPTKPAAQVPVTQADEEPVHTPLPPADTLIGPSALVIPILPVGAPSEESLTIESAPHLIALEQDHPELLRSYIDQSLRWSASLSDQTFYTKPWHVVMTPRNSENQPGFVHASFLRLTDGEQLPTGYTVVKSGAPFPTISDPEAQIPDLALDLDGAHYLLLAWRGPRNAQQAFSALNAAIHEVDEMVRPLAEKPTPATLESLVSGTNSVLEDDPDSPTSPDILLSEPQTACYQAQILANPGESGSFQLIIRDAASGEILRTIDAIPAHFSHNPNAIFRHDIPGDPFSCLHKGVATASTSDRMPVFIIPHKNKTAPIEVSFELYFCPATKGLTRHLITKTYRIVPFSYPKEHSEQQVPPTSPVSDQDVKKGQTH